jgi:hypothetical protein
MLPAPLKFLNLVAMKERSQKPINQKEVDNATLNFVSRQAQEAILNPNLPESYKDQVLDGAIGTISKIAEKRAIYEAGGRRKKYGKRIRTI